MPDICPKCGSEALSQLSYKCHSQTIPFKQSYQCQANQIAQLTATITDLRKRGKELVKWMNFLKLYATQAEGKQVDSALARWREATVTFSGNTIEIVTEISEADYIEQGRRLRDEQSRDDFKRQLNRAIRCLAIKATPEYPPAPRS